MSADITVVVSIDLAREISEGGASFHEFTSDFSLSIEPLHPDSTDAELQRFFIVRVPNEQNAQEIIDKIKKIHGIEGAYVKPPDGPP